MEYALSGDLFGFFLRKLQHMGKCECLCSTIQERVDVDKSKTEGDNLLAAAGLRLPLCSAAVDGGDR